MILEPLGRQPCIRLVRRSRLLHVQGLRRLQQQLLPHSTIGASIITNTIVGVPYYGYSTIYPQTLFLLLTPLYYRISKEDGFCTVLASLSVRKCKTLVLMGHVEVGKTPAAQALALHEYALCVLCMPIPAVLCPSIGSWSTSMAWDVTPAFRLCWWILVSART